MDVEALKRRIKETETERDILLRRIVEVVKKLDNYKEIYETLEDEHNEHHS